MTRAGEGQGSLFGAPRLRPLDEPGRHERALVDAAAAAGLDARFGAGVSAARAAARALDDAELAGKPQIVAQLLGAYLDVLDRLHLVPSNLSAGDPLGPSGGSGAGLVQLLGKPSAPAAASKAG